MLMSAVIALTGCGESSDPDQLVREAVADELTVVWTDPEASSGGFTLIHPIGGTELIWVAMDGSVEKVLDLGFPVTHAEQLPTGNLVVMAQNSMMEIAPDGEVIQLDWPDEGQLLHHDLTRSPRGTFVTLTQEPRPDLGNVWADKIIEVNEFGNTVWEWDALDHLDPATDHEDIDAPHPAFGGLDWLHTNSVDFFDDGDLLVSLRNLNRIVRIDYATGDIEWSWGDGVLGHQHSAEVLDSGNILLFDNGYHRTPGDECVETPCSSRALELDPETGDVVWSFEPGDLFSIGFGDADRLPNGNTLVTFGRHEPEAIVVEVTPFGEVVWSLTSHIAHAVPGVIFEPQATLYRAQRVDEVP